MKSERVQWELAVSGNAAGINLSAMFIVPVFQVAGEQSISHVESFAPEISATRSQTILVKASEAGIEFHYAANALRILFALILNCLLFAAALLYYATQVFQNDGVSVIQGWYLTLLVPVEAVLFAAGTRSFFPKRWTAVVSVFSFFLLALTVYVNVFVMLPYYAGTTVQAGNAAIILDRLLRFHSWLPSLFPALLIVAFVAAGLGLIIGIRKRAQPA